MCDDVHNRLAALCRGFSRTYTDAEKSQIEALYRKIMGRRMRTCRCQDKYHDAVVEMRRKLKTNEKMNTQSNYKLVPGVVIQPEGTSEVYTNANLTDEVAENFLKERPNAVGLFEVIPSPRDEDRKSDDVDELKAAQAQIAELSAERDALQAKCAELSAEVDAAKAAITEPPRAGDDDVDDKGDDAPEGSTHDDKAVEINAKIKAIVAAKLADGKSKTAIKGVLAGKTIEGVKLTQNLVAIYIKNIEAEAE